MSGRTLERVIESIGPVRRRALAAAFAAAGGCPYPPARATLLAVKDEKRLELWAPDAAGRMRHVKDYQVLAASGGLGPKLREGDRQVPEGIYRVVALNPQSRFHLSLRLDYPNEFDLAQARRDGRSEPGSDIFIHGGAASIGCLAMGDEAVEELFLLAHETGPAKLAVIIVPADFRRREFPPPPGAPAWTAELYARLRAAAGELRE
jgi:murein L,D-transpeptidase YafK